ncbi:hypothetical protein B1756_14395 [Natrarchaeobaculum aegyptiacum]|uniref:Uncharacterized protein n=1 Tax=Natrarchaeobaculum aegyptiacum TaxID=745377 RepID=A0A2Z2HVJ3_9EURY|nr:hypothetical protein B1756_14395 [Natrarchaeobaculum aegyptiacum]
MPAAADGETGPANELEADGNVYQFEQDGVASAEISPGVDVTIAEDSDDVGYDDFIVDSVNDFLKVENTVNSDRKVEFYVSNEYFAPRPNDGLRSLTDGPEASLKRVAIDGEQYTEVSVEFESDKTVIYPVDKIMGGVFTVRDGTKDVITNETPVPETKNEEIWEERSVDVDEVRNDTTIVDATFGDENRTEIYVAYEPDRTLPAGEKLPVPECGTPADIDDVCIEDERGGEAQILFKNVGTAEPEIMYKHDIGFIESMALGANDMAQIPERIDIPFLGGEDG